MRANGESHLNQFYLRKHSCSACTPNFHTKAATDIRASESKIHKHCHGGVVCPNCMHTACNSMYFERAGAVHTKSKKQKHMIQNAPSDSWRFLKAACGLPADCSCSSRSLLGTASLNKRLQTDRAVVGHQRENQRTFSP